MRNSPDPENSPYQNKLNKQEECKVQNQSLYSLAGKPMSDSAQEPNKKQSEKAENNLMDGNKKRGGAAAQNNEEIKRDFQIEEEGAVLQRSERFMDFNDRDFNEYVSDEE